MRRIEGNKVRIRGDICLGGKGSPRGDKETAVCYSCCHLTSLLKGIYRLKPKHKDAATKFAQAAKRVGMRLIFACRKSS
jgi:hypothetical protein